MCGIFGFVNYREEGLLEKMSRVLTHRGPDDEGYYQSGPVSLGHRRLSIIDLATGQQPMGNEDKTVQVVFNGEIYNYIEVRERLRKAGHRFRTQSDTEVIVHAYEEHGEDCLAYFNGEFSFALWDQPRRRLFLARDRMGIRPLYYAAVDGGLIFASELKAILCSKKISRRLRPEALDAYLSLRYVPFSESIMEGVFRLPAAHALIIEGEGAPKIQKYWTVDFSEEMRGPDKDVVGQFSDLLSDSVKLRLRSDVPLGAFLSGGVDSSVLVALMRKNNPGGLVKTFTVGFESAIDEVEGARKVADYFGTDHTSTIIEKQSYRLLFDIVRQLDEPVGDAIVIPTYLLSREAVKSVKVVLTGEGADEILGGYIHHAGLVYGAMAKRALPAMTRRFISKHMIRQAAPGFLNRFFPYPASLGKQGRDRLAAYFSGSGDLLESFFTLTSLFGEEEKKELLAPGFLDFVPGRKGQGWKAQMRSNLSVSGGALNKIINMDLHAWLSDYTLFKQDRLSMANSLEARVPFLDHRLVEFCARLPVRFKMRGRTVKYLLREAAAGLVPRDVAFAPKKAFYFPTEKFFLEDFDHFVRDLLTEGSVRRRGIFNPAAIARRLKNVRSDELLSNKQLMALVILELWFREFLDGVVA